MRVRRRLPTLLASLRRVRLEGCSVGSSSDSEYEPTVRPRKRTLPYSRPSESSADSGRDFLGLGIDSKFTPTTGSDSAADLSVLQCLANGIQPPVTEEMLQRARATADSNKKSNSSLLRQDSIYSLTIVFSSVELLSSPLQTGLTLEAHLGELLVTHLLASGKRIYGTATSSAPRRQGLVVAAVVDRYHLEPCNFQIHRRLSAKAKPTSVSSKSVPQSGKRQE